MKESRAYERATLSHPSPKEPQDFSLVLGGPLFQLLRRVRLSDDALALLLKRLLVIPLLAWLPLLILSILDGSALGGTVPIPFLLDVEVNVRFLVALPLLILAELVVHHRMRPVVQEFLDRDLISRDDRAHFDAAVASTLRLRNSVVAEVLILAFVYIVGVTYVWQNFVALSTASTWYSTPSSQGLKLSHTGVWYAYVSLPIFQFLLVRWYYRMALWARFLWKVSRLKLGLIPTHPDGLGGLAFVSGTVFAFAPLATAHGAMVAGPLANRILYLGASLPDFKVEILGIVVFLLCLILGPLLVFVPRLARAKQVGLREYGILAGRYTRDFDQKWMRGGASAREALLGSGDIQSLADMGGSFDVVEKMRVVPVTKDALIRLVVATLLPVIPLVLTLMSPAELLKKVFSILL